MNEIEKLYENAGIEPKKKCYYWDCPYSTGMPANDIPYTERNCQDCNNPDKAVYPPFTAEKQLELIKWLMREKYLIGRYIESYYELFTNSMISYNSKNECFEKFLAELINNLWQDLTEEERKQIKEILE